MADEQTPVNALPATFGHVERVTNNQTDVLKFAGWVRTAVTVLVIVLGMFGLKIVQTTPTPPDVGVQQILDVLGKQQPPTVVVQPANPAPLRTMDEILTALKALEGAQKKGP